MSVILGTTENRKELIVSCKDGCDEGIRIVAYHDDDPLYKDYAVLTYQSGHWYKEQEYSFIEKCKKIWRIIKNKDYYYSEIFMTKEDFEKFKEYVNSIGEWKYEKD